MERVHITGTVMYRCKKKKTFNWEFLIVQEEFVQDMIDLFDFCGHCLLKMGLVYAGQLG